MSSEAVMLTCVIDATENKNVAIVDIPNAFVQTVVEDEKDRAALKNTLEFKWYLFEC